MNILGKCAVPLRRPKRSWDDYFRMNVIKLNCNDGKKIELAGNRVHWWVLKFKFDVASPDIRD